MLLPEHNLSPAKLWELGGKATGTQPVYMHGKMTTHFSSFN